MSDYLSDNKISFLVVTYIYSKRELKTDQFIPSLNRSSSNLISLESVTLEAFFASAGHFDSISF